MWYAVSGVIVLIALASILIRGFTFGIDFEGGTKVSMPVAGANGNAEVTQVETSSAKPSARRPNRW